MDKKILRLLIVDDSPDDAEIATTALRKAGFMLKTQRVQDLASMQAALEKGAWDAVVSEYQFPHFGAALALDLLKRLGIEMPFVVLARHIRDTDLEQIMRAGARDVVRKQEIARLPPVIERELAVFQERRAYREALARLAELEAKSRAIIEGTHEAICYCQDGMHLDANKAYLEVFGYGSFDEIQGIPVMDLIDKADQARFKEYLRKAGSQTQPQTQEFMAVRRDGTRFPAELTVSAITVNGERCVQIVASDISKRKAVESRLQYLNQHDPLTGLLNRHFFLQQLDKAIEAARQGSGTSGLIYIDLHQIKEINETLGHATGDRILLKVARLMRERLGDEAVLARFGGEFTVLLRGVDRTGLEEAATLLRTAMKDTRFTEEGQTFTCGCSFGMALVDAAVESAQKLLAQVYQDAQRDRPAPSAAAAATGGRAVQREPTAASASQAAAQTHEPASLPPQAATGATGRLDAKTAVAARGTQPGSGWATRLQAALEKDAFQLAYQPIINLHGDPAELFEVLVRLAEPNGESISAAQFMAAAEEAGLAASIDRWVTQAAIKALAELHRQDRRARFFLNLSAQTLRDPEFLIAVQKQLREVHLKPEYLVFEADESTLAAHPAEAEAFLKAVRRVGCRFAVDNFGTTPRALEPLHGLPIDFVKVNGGLIENLTQDAVAQASLKALLQVARALSAPVIAKSVERAEDLATLWSLGVDYAQGHYFQVADSRLDYEFTDEATLSSETSAPHWANRHTR